MWRNFVLLGLLTSAPFAQAAVSISEVAWIGSLASPNHEWIELYNDGEAVDVTDWTLTDGNNLTITLTGTLPPNYSVLERSSEESAPGTAFFIYTGALVNTGATLTMKRSDGSIVDQVVGGENWESIGGDNETKDTAQYTSSGWVSGPGTPGASNVSTGSISTPVTSVEDTEEPKEATPIQTKKSSSGRSAAAGEPVRLAVPNMELTLAIKAQTIGYVNQPITFTVTPAGLGKTSLHSLNYAWSFGDGMSAAIKNPTHAFAYPGTYIVTVKAVFAKYEQVARHDITILPVAFSLVRLSDGAIQIQNNLPYEIDVSGYTVRGRKTVTLPPLTIMAAQGTLTIPPERLGDTKEFLVALFDPAAAMVASTLKTQSVPVAIRETSVALASASTEPTAGGNAILSSESMRLMPVAERPPVAWLVEATPAFSFEDQALTPQSDTSLLQASSTTIVRGVGETVTTSQRATVRESLSSSNVWPYLGLVVLIAIGMSSLLLRPPRNESP